MQDMKWERVGVLASSDPYSSDLAGNIEDGCAKRGIEVVVSYRIDQNQQGVEMTPVMRGALSSYLTSMKQSGVRIIVYSGYPLDMQYVVKEAAGKVFPLFILFMLLCPFITQGLASNTTHNTLSPQPLSIIHPLCTAL
jgi:hypothetical protein